MPELHQAEEAIRAMRRAEIGLITLAFVRDLKRMGYSEEEANAVLLDTLRSGRPAQDADARDAARYRWLRDTGDATWRPFGIREGFSAAKADAAIDSAMAQARKEGGNG